MCPRQGSNFLLLAQEKVTKEKGTPLAGRPGADCSALLGLCGRAELTSFAVLTALRQAARSQFLMRAGARAAKPCAARRLTRAPRAIRSFASQTFPVHASLRIGTGAHRCARCEAAWDRECLRSKRPHCSWAPSEPSSSAGLCGRARLRAPRELTSRRLFERSEQSERSEFGAAAKTEQRRAVGPRPTGDEGRLSFAYFSLAKQRKVGRLSGRHPDAASAVSKSHPKAQARLRYLSPNGRGRAQGFDRLSPNGVGLSQNGDGLNPNGQHRASTKPQGVTTWTA